MAIFRASCFLLAALLAAMSPATGAPTPAERARAAAVVLIARDGTRTAVGAGVIVEIQPLRALVLTANHIASFGDLFVRFPGASPVAARVIRQYPGQDLALVEAPLDPGAMLPEMAAAAFPATPALGEPIFVWGASDDLEPVLERGSVLDAAPFFRDGSARGTFAIVCKTCRHGDSGSGIYDAGGRLLGILVAAWVAPDGTVTAIEAEPIPNDPALAAR